jgi:hypothetical protein
VQYQRLAQACHCACGESRFEIDGTPLTRFVCHCTICQSYTGGAYSDVTTFWAGAVSIPAEFPVTFKKYRPPPNVSRGLCQRCGNPVVEFMTLAPFVRVSFVPTRNIPDAQKLPPPSAHIFYHRRVKDIEDSVPKITGYWSSELAVTRQILAGLLRR